MTLMELVSEMSCDSGGPQSRWPVTDRPLGRRTPSRKSPKMPPRANPYPWPARPSII